MASLFAVRFVDVTRLEGHTADGEPATLSHWRRYSTGLLLICSGSWLAAHAIAFFMEK